jgi:hypothetical protein
MAQFKVKFRLILITVSIILIVFAFNFNSIFKKKHYIKFEEAYNNFLYFRGGKAEDLRISLKIDDSFAERHNGVFKSMINSNDVKIAMGYKKNSIRKLPSKVFGHPTVDHNLEDSMGYCEGRLYSHAFNTNVIKRYSAGQKNDFDSIGIPGYCYIFEGAESKYKGERKNFVFYFDSATDTLIPFISGYIQDEV